MSAQVHLQVQKSSDDGDVVICGSFKSRFTDFIFEFKCLEFVSHANPLTFEGLTPVKNDVVLQLSF
jgi:hypothetical protein